MIPLPTDRRLVLVHLVFGDTETPNYDQQRARGCERPIHQPTMPQPILDALTSQP